MAIYRGPGGSGDATEDAASEVSLIVEKVAEANTAATSAASSAASAATSAASAAASASGVAGYAAAAAASAADALESENNAATSETNAAASAADAADDAATASTQATSASASASSASTSASNAASSASSAATSASNAATSATNASNSASAAATSASNAAISEDNAADSAALAAGYFPSLTGNTGKYLRTNGTSNYWDTVDALPSQTGNSGKFLTTNGTAASWGNIAAATPTVNGLLYGLTDAGTYYAPATVSGAWFANPTSTSIYTSTDGDYNGQSNPQNIIDNAVNGNIAVGKILTLVLTEIATSSLVQVNAGAITGVSYVNTGGSTNHSITITFTNAINWSLYQHTSIFLYERLIVDSLILSGNKAENVLLGYSAGNNITVGGENVVVGAGAGNTLTEGRNNLIIGNASEPSSATVNNEVTLGNSSHTKTRLYGALAMGGSSVGTSGQVLTSNGSGSAPSWSSPASGTVTSVSLTVPTGLSVAGSPITSSGTLAVTFASGYSIPTTSSQTNWDTAYTDRMKWDGGATDLVASTGRTSLGLVIGTDIPSVSGSGASGTWGISISGNAATVTNGLYSTGTYSNPSWLTTLAGSKITGTIDGGTY